ncbi:class I SAM-dependent methyltransferase [Lacibacter luteus]|uniref:Class I SAM-dependent methyltransferase n=1 Tax=Lacibacter luteus TaxID=2508719 RepID=A0A4V1M7C9_9BACT|nr:class I SAM-dependent methyltransferase [Lacibacter luteus]RXK59304.1 class I SAM-dependent methyltransferase [Lacibacter luteus]
MKSVNLSSQQAFNYEKHVWGHAIDQNGYDFPRLKFDHLYHALSFSSPVKILEVGCGAGKFLFSLAELFPHSEFIGVDISEPAIKKAQAVNVNKKINFIVGDAEKLHFEENVFDAIIMLDVLEHLENPQKMIDDCYRFLKPGGVIHTFIPCEAHSVYWLGEKIFGFHTKEKTVGHIQRFSRKSAEALFSGRFVTIQKKFSFHLMGSIMDYILFSALLNKKISSIFWTGNKYYNSSSGSKSIKAKLLNSLLVAGSFIAYFESFLMQNSCFCATGVHLTLQKK